MTTNLQIDPSKQPFLGALRAANRSGGVRVRGMGPTERDVFEALADLGYVHRINGRGYAGFRTSVAGERLLADEHSRRDPTGRHQHAVPVDPQAYPECPACRADLQREARHTETHRTCYRCEKLGRPARHPVAEFTQRSNGTFFSACKACNKEMGRERRAAAKKGAR